MFNKNYYLRQINYVEIISVGGSIADAHYRNVHAVFSYSMPSPEYMYRKNVVRLLIELSRFLTNSCKYRIWTKTLWLSPQANYTDRATAAVGEVVPKDRIWECQNWHTTDEHHPLIKHVRTAVTSFVRIQGLQSQGAGCLSLFKPYCNWM
jgi:hypothetical protein